MKRHTIFALGEIYHICNKSISNYEIFRKEEFSQRFLNICAYYSQGRKSKYSDFLRKEKIYNYVNLLQIADSQYKCLSYCIMPDHYHLLIQASLNIAISTYIGKVENSYTRFYNLSNNRKGPLWQSSFRCTRIASNEQLLHVIRYIHLNPVTNSLISNPQDWKYSSHSLYLKQEILNSLKLVSIKSVGKFEKFVLDNQDYQKRLRVMKSALRDY
jgi:putative transposase